MTTRTPGPIECDRQVIVGDHSLNGVLSWLTRVNSNAWTISSIAFTPERWSNLSIRSNRLNASANTVCRSFFNWCLELANAGQLERLGQLNASMYFGDHSLIGVLSR